MEGSKMMDETMKKRELPNSVLQNVAVGENENTNGNKANKRVDCCFIPNGYTGTIYTYYCLKEQKYYASTSYRSSCQRCHGTVIKN